MGASRRVVAGLVLVAVGAAACADGQPTDFTADTREGFLAACSVPLDDSRLTSDICQCVFERTQEEISFERFTAIDEQLQDPARPLPDEITDIIAECVIEEADL